MRRFTQLSFATSYSKCNEINLLWLRHTLYLVMILKSDFTRYLNLFQIAETTLFYSDVNVILDKQFKSPKKDTLLKILSVHGNSQVVFRCSKQLVDRLIWQKPINSSRKSPWIGAGLHHSHLHYENKSRSVGECQIKW